MNKLLYSFTVASCSACLLSHRDLEVKQKCSQCAKTNSNFTDFFFFSWDLGDTSEPQIVKCIQQIFVACQLCAGTILDAGDTAENKGGKPFAPLFWNAAALGLWDLRHF